MKYVHHNGKGKILGYYDDNIHSKIPIPNHKISEDCWQNAINNCHNKINDDGSTEFVELRTLSEIKTEKVLGIKAKAESEILGKYPYWKQANIQSNFIQYPENEIFKIEFEKMRLFINQVRANADNEVLLLENS